MEQKLFELSKKFDTITKHQSNEDMSHRPRKSLSSENSDSVKSAKISQTLSEKNAAEKRIKQGRI